MTELIITIFLILLTLGLIICVRSLALGYKLQTPRPRAYITVCFNNDPCFELKFQKLVSSRLFSDFDVTVRVLDLVNTDDSTKWLKSLSRKTDVYFDIINKI